MHRHFFAIATTVAIVVAPVAAHAQSAAFSPGTVEARGAEARVTVRLALGSRQQLRRERQPLRLDLSAGPAWRVASLQPLGESRRLTGDVIRLSMAPRHSTRLSLAGTPVWTSYADRRIAAAEGGTEGGEGGGVSTLAIVGGVLLGGLGVAYLAFEDAIDCTENGEYVCE